MDRKRILVVDDEEDICAILKFNLEKAGYDVATAFSAEEALEINILAFDCLLLDVMMGKMSGFEMAAKIKSDPKTERIPIIFLTARGTEEDTVRGLELGADDYISKPFSLKEVLARVKAVLRRAKEAAPHVDSDGIVILDGRKKVLVDGREVPLTRTEYDVLKLLKGSPGMVFSRQDILEKVWPDEVIVTERSVDVAIARLRKKIGVHGPRISSRHGFGYCYDEE